MDFYKDSDKSELCAILHTLQKNGIHPPKAVMTKTADEKVENIPAKSYAYPEKRMFPIHNLADTWLSAAYFSYKQADLPKTAKDRIKSMIHKGAKLWDIDEDTLIAMDKVLGPSLGKKADTGSEKITNKQDFKNYCERALGKFKDLSLTQRKQLSNQILKTADENEWRLDPADRKKLEQTACRGYGHKDLVSNYLQSLRGNLPKHASEYDRVLETCISEIEKGPHFPSPDILAKTAALTDMVLHSPKIHISRDLLPERSIFQISQTEAEQARNTIVKLPGEKVVWKQALEDNKGNIAADLSAIIGGQYTTVDSIVKGLKQLTPVINEKILSSID